MRDRLVALINEAKDEYPTIPSANCCKPTFAYYLADRLLANGVILPLCKVGDIVYIVTPGGRIHEKKVLGSKSVVGSNMRDEIWVKHSFTCESALVFNEDDIGKTVFITHEEAEQALKESVMTNEQLQLERHEMAKIIADNAPLDTEFDDSDFEWAAHSLQVEGFHNERGVALAVIHEVFEIVNKLQSDCTFKQRLPYLKVLKELQEIYNKYRRESNEKREI